LSEDQKKSNTRRLWPLLLFALLPLIPLWRCVFLGEAIGPFDQIRQMAPWNGPKPSQPWDVLQADGVLQFYPWRDMVFKAWGEGQLPLWNPHQLAGTPLLANSQSAGFYPPHVLLGILHVPTVPAMTLLAWFHLFWAGLGTYMLARRLGATKEGASIAGASFAMSAFMLAWTALPSVISTTAWIPWMLAAIAALLSPSGPGDRRSMLGRCAMLAFSTGMMILAGHLQFVAYGVMGAFIFALALAGMNKPSGSGRSLVSIGGALLLGFLLAAPQLLPVLSFSQFSHRKNVASDAGYKSYTDLALKPFELANLTHAYTLGSPRTAVDVQGGTISAYWPSLDKAGANLAESAVTIGPLVVGLLALLPWRKRQVWPLAIVGIVALLLALGTVLNYPLYFFVPGWSSSGSPGRIIVLFVLCSCVAAGVALGQDLESITKRQRYIALAAPPVAAALCLWLSQSAGAINEISVLSVDATWAAMQPALLGGLIGSAGIALVIFPGAKKYRPALLALPAILAWLSHASNITMTGAPIGATSSQGLERVAVINNKWSLLLRPAALFPPNTAYLGGLHELGGYDSLLHKDTATLLADVDGQNASPPENGNMMFVKPSADLKKLADAGVTGIVTLREMPELGPPKRSAEGYYVYPLSGTGRVASPQGKGEVVGETFSKLVVEANGPGRLVVRDRNMPGWLAKVDGKHVATGGDVWREVDLPPGHHTVEFNYVPPGLMTGIYIGVPSWLLLAGLAILTRRRKAA
jgi:hypothetical protein